MTEGELATLLRRAFSMDQYLTVAEAAEYARCHKTTVYGWINSGLIAAYAPRGAKTIVKKADIDGLVRRSRIDPDTIRKGPNQGKSRTEMEEALA